MSHGLLVLGIAVDPVHAGAGRAPGAVDLPVQRDALGYPLIYASSVKGALKSLCARKLCKGKGSQGIDGSTGYIKCSSNGNCRLCCCFFGSEPGERETMASSRISVLDLIPVAFPAPSSEHGFVYVTSPVLLSRALLELELLNSSSTYVAALKSILEKLYEKSLMLRAGQAIVYGNSLLDNAKPITIGTSPLMVEDRVEPDKEKDQQVRSLLGRLGGLAISLLDKIAVVSANDGQLLIERSLVRVARIALRRDRKIVARGALWTEEYLPYGTVFLTGLIDTGLENTYCNNVKDPIDELRSKVLSEKNGKFYVTVGGKETVGKGLIKFVVA